MSKSKDQQTKSLQHRNITEEYQPDEPVIPVKSYTIVIDLEKKNLREIVPIPPIENLVLKGGGVKGTAYVGALHELNLPSLKRVSGASAGAITAFMIALGLKSDEIQQMSNDTPLSSLVEKVPKAGIKATVIYNRTHKEIDDARLDSGQAMLDALREIIRERVYRILLMYPDKLNGLGIDINHVTFKDLKDISIRCPEANFKDLIVTGVKLTKDSNDDFQGEVEYFSTESKSSENMEVALAVRISASIPYFYKAVNYNGNLYIDGGCLDNFPIGIFDDPKYKPENTVKYMSANGVNLCTLGLRVDSKFDRENALFNRRKIIEKQMSRAEEVSGKLKDTVIHTDKTGTTNLSNYDLYHKYSHTTIQLDDHDIDMADFGMSNEKRDKLISENKTNTADWLNTYRDETLAMEDKTYAYKTDIKEAVLSICNNMTKSELSEFVILLERKTPGLLVNEDREDVSPEYYDQFSAIAKQVLNEKENESQFSRFLQELETIKIEIMQNADIGAAGLNPLDIVKSKLSRYAIAYNTQVILDHVETTIKFAKSLQNTQMTDNEKITITLSRLAPALNEDSQYNYVLNNILENFSIKKESIINPYFDIAYQINLQFERLKSLRDKENKNGNPKMAHAVNEKIQSIKEAFVQASSLIKKYNTSVILSDKEKAIILLQHVKPALDLHTNRNSNEETFSTATIMRVASTHGIVNADLSIKLSPEPPGIDNSENFDINQDKAIINQDTVPVQNNFSEIPKATVDITKSETQIGKPEDKKNETHKSDENDPNKLKITINNPYQYKTNNERQGRWHALEVNGKDFKTENGRKLKDEYLKQKGDYLKTRILSDFKNQIEQAPSKDFDEFVKRLKETAEYQVLAKGQGVVTRVAGSIGLKTSSVEAFNEMVKDRKNLIKSENEGVITPKIT